MVSRMNFMWRKTSQSQTNSNNGSSTSLFQPTASSMSQNYNSNGDSAYISSSNRLSSSNSSDSASTILSMECPGNDDFQDFEVTVPRSGNTLLGLDLRARYEPETLNHRGAIVRGFRPVDREGRKGFIEETGQVLPGDILFSMGGSDIDQMSFDKIIGLAQKQQQDVSVWPLTLKFRRLSFQTEPVIESKTRRSSFFGSRPTFVNHSAQDGTFNEKLQYFRGFFANRMPTGTSATSKGESMIPLMPSEEVVNDMYRDILLRRGVPENVLDELIRTELPEKKWRFVYAAQQADQSEDVMQSNGAVKMAENLVKVQWDAKGLKELEQLRAKLSTSSDDFVRTFVDNFGLDYLAIQLPNASPFRVEADKFIKACQVCRIILEILKTVGHFSGGIESMINMPGLIQKITLCFHTDDVDLKRLTLQLLGLICYYNAEGHQGVIDSFEYYKTVKGESIRFTALRDALKSSRYSLDFKEDVLSFINVLVNKTSRLEDRLLIRGDFVSLGMPEYFEEVRSKSNAVSQMLQKKEKNQSPLQLSTNVDKEAQLNLESDSHPLSLNTTENYLGVESESLLQLTHQMEDVERQIEVFEAFMEEDRKDTIYGETDLSDVGSVFQSLVKRCAADAELHQCMTSLLQHLLFIPTDGKLGKEMWHLCAQSVREICFIEEMVELEKYELPYETKKSLLYLRDQFTEFLENYKPKQDDSWSIFRVGGKIPLMQNRLESDIQGGNHRDSIASNNTEESFLNQDSEGFNSLKKNRKQEESGLNHQQAIPAEEHELYQKYFKLKRMGMPDENIRLKMSAEGLDPAVLDYPRKLMDPIAPISNSTSIFPMISTQPSTNTKANTSSVSSQLFDQLHDNVESGKEPHSPTLKYQKLLKMGMPIEHVRAKMLMENVDPSLLVEVSTTKVNVMEKKQEQKSTTLLPTCKKQEDTKAALLSALLANRTTQTNRMPTSDVSQKSSFNADANQAMMALGNKVAAESVEREEKATCKTGGNESGIAPRKLAREDPNYAKYYRLKQMGMPLEHLKLKMSAEGLDATVLEDENAPLPSSASERNSNGSQSQSAHTNGSLSSRHSSHVLPKKELRSLYWEALNSSNIHGTIWAGLLDSDSAVDDDEEVADGFDVEHFEAQFTNAQRKFPVKDKLSVATASQVKKEERKNSRVCLVDMKRANNIGIMLARFRLPFEQLRLAVLKVDKEILTIEKVQAMLQFAPDSDELTLVRQYQGDKKLLGDTEQYFLEIASIPRFKSRLQALLASWQFESHVEEQSRMITIVGNACVEVQNSCCFRKILRVTLQLGNLLNQGTPRGAARGFRLDVLTKLSQLRTTDGQSTLLSYLASVLRKKNPKLLDFENEMTSLKDATRITHQTLKAGLACIVKAARIICTEVDAHRQLTIPAPPAAATLKSEVDRFQEEVGPLSKVAEERARKVEAQMKEMSETFEATLKCFGEDPQKADAMGPDTFFSLIHSFASMLKAADRENERNRIQTERKQRREKETRKRLESLQEAKETISNAQQQQQQQLKLGEASEIIKMIKEKREAEKRDLMKAATHSNASSREKSQRGVEHQTFISSNSAATDVNTKDVPFSFGATTTKQENAFSDRPARGADELLASDEIPTAALNENPQTLLASFGFC